LKEKQGLHCIKGIEEVIKMKKTILTLSATAFVLGGLLVIPNAVNAYRGDPNVKGPNFNEERHQQIEQVFENNNYQDWKNLMEGRGRVLEVINEGNFSQFAEAHKLAEEGKIDEARKIRQELGLGLKNGSGQGRHQKARF
jgi:hypothetical protein